MAITNLAGHITGVTNTGTTVLGAATPAPYASASVTAFTDGTSPATASKNMAEIYNRLEFERQWIIEQAGATFDAANWAQGGQAIKSVIASSAQVITPVFSIPATPVLGQFITNSSLPLTAVGGFLGFGEVAQWNGSAWIKLHANYASTQYGTLGTALTPTATPTAASPATRVVNTNGEVFDWNGTGWFLTGNGYDEKIPLVVGVTAVSSVGIGATFICPRAGVITVGASMRVLFDVASTAYIAILSINGALIVRGDANGTGENAFGYAQSTIEVVAGQPIQVGVYNASGIGVTLTATGDVDILYIK